MQVNAHNHTFPGLLVALFASFCLVTLSMPLVASADDDPEAEEEKREQGQRRPSSEGRSYRVGAPSSSSSVGRMDREQMSREDMQFDRSGFDSGGFSLEPEFGSSGVGMDLDIRPSRSEDRRDRRVVEEERSTSQDDLEDGLVENQDLQPLRIEAPRYPTQAHRANIEGFAVVAFIVDVYGETKDIRVVESSPGDVFDRAAREAVERWRFEPRVVDGRPVATEVTQVIDFDMDR